MNADRLLCAPRLPNSVGVFERSRLLARMYCLLCHDCYRCSSSGPAAGAAGGARGPATRSGRAARPNSGQKSPRQSSQRATLGRERAPIPHHALLLSPLRSLEEHQNTYRRHFRRLPLQPRSVERNPPRLLRLRLRRATARRGGHQSGRGAAAASLPSVETTRMNGRLGYHSPQQQSPTTSLSLRWEERRRQRCS